MPLSEFSVKMYSKNEKESTSKTKSNGRESMVISAPKMSNILCKLRLILIRFGTTNTNLIEAQSNYLTLLEGRVLGKLF